MSFRKIALIAAAFFGSGLVILPAQDDLPSLLKTGAELEQRQEWIKATEVYTKATVAYPSQAIGFERLGDLYRKNGVFSRAADNYRKALELDPSNAQLRALLESCERAAEEQAGGVVQAATFRDLAAAVRGVQPRAVETTEAEAESIPFHINFPRNRYLIGDLNDTARRQLDEVAALLTSPEWRDRRPLIVEGHACSCGSDAANMALGRKRGEAVLGYLISKGDLQKADAAVVSMGKSKPVVASDKENLSAEACARDEAHNQNRRVIIRQAHGSAAPLVTFWYRPVGSDTLRPLTDGSVLYRKDEIRVKVQAASPLFAYVVHHGPDNAWEVLYPRGGAANAALLPADALRDGRWIPGAESGFSVRGKTGDEAAFVYLSQAPIPEFEERQKVSAVPAAPAPATAAPATPQPVTPQPATPQPAASHHAVAKPVAAPGSVVVGIDDEVRSLAAPTAFRLAGPPHALQPAATVNFKSHD
jgi:outer membrane protein OmpA-like peptidoglycan-associated protein